VLRKLAIQKSSTMISYHRIQNDDELYEILQLQKQNLPLDLTDIEQKKEGFVTIQHTFDILKKMNTVCLHCIAKIDNKVVGYALCMDTYFKDKIDLLKPMFIEIDNAIKNEDAVFTNYIAMGQICIDKAHRKKGIFRGLYTYMQQELDMNYRCIITGVNSINTRSLNAHKAVGFESLKTYTSGGGIWKLLALKFQN